MEQVILFLFIFLLPTQLAYHFWPKFAYVFGLRVDYLAPAIYLTDILLVLLVLYLVRKLKKNLRPGNLVLPGLLILLALLNTLFAKVSQVALFKWITVLKLVVVGLYFYSLDVRRFKKTILFAGTLSIILFTTIGCIQFIRESTIGGIFYYLGERTFSSQTPGIALASVFGHSLMRAYSTFSHPNSFVAFIVVMFLLLLPFISNKKLLVTLLFFVVLCLSITLSLGVLIGLLSIVTYLLLNKRFSGFGSKLSVYFPVVLIAVSLLFPVILGGLNASAYLTNRDFSTRIFLARSALRVFSEHPIMGVGLNNFLLEPSIVVPGGIMAIQPVHNIYLLILSETGILGIVFFYVLLSYYLKRIYSTPFFIAILFILVTGLFDHYSLTLQQNLLLFAAVVGISLNKYFVFEKHSSHK